MTEAVSASNKSESTRDQLLRAATEVFSERGYEGTDVREIARRAGRTTGSIYANFSGKAQLLLEAIGARGGADFDELLRSGAVSTTAATLLADLGSHLLDDTGSSAPGLLVEAFVAARRDGDLAAFVGNLAEERMRGLGLIVGRARHEGDIAESVSTDALVRFAIVLALGSLLFKAVGLEQPNRDEWSSLIRRFVAALREDS
jgi:AcrR family transcriptional regulator